jgi:hypothetical protein
MSNLCIPKNLAVKLKIAIEKGDVSVEALRSVSSTERNKIFKEFLGDETLAKQLNVGFEQRMASTRKGILDDYIERELTRLPKGAKKELSDQLASIEDKVMLDGNFLETLAENKLGTRLSQEAAEVVFKQAQKVNELKYGVDGKGGVKNILDNLEASIDTTKFAKKDEALAELNRLADKDEAFQEARMAYGKEAIDLSNLHDDAVLYAKGGYKDVIKDDIAVWRKGVNLAGKFLMESFGTTKSLLATFDNSLWGRQGMKTLLTNPEIWLKNFPKSFSDIVRTWFSPKTQKAETFNPYTGKLEPSRFGAIQAHVYDEVKAEIISRPNAIKGYYSAANNNYGLILDTEEAFPTSILERLPTFLLAGRAHKGFEVAYNAGAMRIRADLADKMISYGEKKGLNMLDKVNADAMGSFVGSFTGRGDLGKSEVLASDLGTILFSPRFFKSQLDTLGYAIGLSGMKGPDAIRLKAAQETWTYIAATAGILAVADMAGITEPDPRSSDFGSIIVGDVKIDVTGGSRSLVSLIAKLTTGKYKQSVTGIITPTRDNAQQAFGSYILNKSAPIPSAAMQLINREYFGGETPSFRTPSGIATFVRQIATPISTQTLEEAIATQDSGLEILIYVTADFFGGSTRPYQIRPQGGEWKVMINNDKKLYEEKVKELNEQVKELLIKKQKDKAYQKKEKAEQDKELIREINRIKKNVLR